MMVKERRVASSASYPDSILFFWCEEVNADTEYLSHSHQWGQIICVKSGVFILNIEGQRFLAPSGFALWIPPETTHSSHNHKPTWFRSININAQFCKEMPKQPCLLSLSAITHAIIASFFERNMMVPETEQDRRLCQVLIDQLQVEPLQHSYLPSSDDKYLSPILNALEVNPADETTLAEWAKKVYATERTLARRCQNELGMTFSEWRHRLRFLYSISLLEQGKTVQDISFEVGYSSTSAFITMFKKIAGVTPEFYRQQSGDNRVK